MNYGINEIGNGQKFHRQRKPGKVSAAGYFKYMMKYQCTNHGDSNEADQFAIVDRDVHPSVHLSARMQ